MWHDVRSLNATAGGLMAITVVASLAAGVWWISQRPMFTLKAVRVESIYDMDLKHVSEITVRNSVVGKITGNFFTANLEQVRATFEAVPWVRRATVRREWPVMPGDVFTSSRNGRLSAARSSTSTRPQPSQPSAL